MVDKSKVTIFLVISIAIVECNYRNGMKTADLKYHHNYSKVVYQQKVDETTEIPRSYNSHSYGTAQTINQRRSENLITYYRVVNGSVVGETRKNPNTTTIIIQRKKKQAPKIQIFTECPPGETGQFVYELSCNQFLNCWKGKGYPQNCAPGTLFNPKTLECDFPDKVECVSGSRAPGPLVKSENLKQASCPKQFSGMIPDYFDCTKFINCANGVEYRMDCPPGTLFDMKRNLCDFPKNCQCFNHDLDASGQADQNSEWRHGEFGQGSGRWTDQAGQWSSVNHGQSHGSWQETNQGHVTGHSQGSGQWSSPSQNQGNGQWSHGQSQGSSQWTSQGQGSSTGHDQNRGRDNQGRWSSNTFDETQGSLHGTNPGEPSGQWTNHGQSSGQNQGQWSSSNHEQTQGSLQGSNQAHPHRQWTNQGHSSSHYQGQNPNPGQGSGQWTNQGQSSGQNQGTGQVTSTGYGQNHGQWSSSSYDRTQGSLQGANQGQANEQWTNHGDSSIQSQGTVHHGRWTSNSHHQTQEALPGYNQGQESEQWINQGHFTSRPSDGQNRGNVNQATNHGQWTSTSHRQTQGSIHGVKTGRNPIDPNQGQWSSTNQNQGSSYQGINQNLGWEQPINQGTDQNQEWNQESNGGSRANQHQGRWSNQNQKMDDHLGGGRGSTKCPPRSTGLHPHPNDCSKFLNCANGVTYVQDCGPGTIFNPITQICDFPYNVKCTSSGGGGSSGSFEESVTGGGSNWGGGGSGGNTYPHTTHEQINEEWHENQNQWLSTTSKPVRIGWETHGQGSGITAHWNGIGHLTTSKPSSNLPSSQDYEDVIGSGSNTHIVIATPRNNEQKWPPPFPSTDINADYVFEYEDADDEVTLEASNSISQDQEVSKCGKNTFKCHTSNKCIGKTSVCDHNKDCQDGSDEIKCIKDLGKFNWIQNSRLAVLEKERWDNVTMTTCAFLCLESIKFQCKSFNYRKIDRTCFLTDTNIGLTGVLISYYPSDYYELISEIIDCSDKFVCSNSKCLDKSRVCDGQDDCGDRQDEKDCQPEKLGYSIKLAGSDKKNEGYLVVTAFGRTGYVCDDKFSIIDANVACRELGFNLGAAEVKANSYFIKRSSPLQQQTPFYMMDDVTCTGNETSLINCDFSGWGKHKCQGQEVVGVVCKTPQEKCSKDYWQCRTGQECLPLAFVCDGLLDCTDESDEDTQRCDEPTVLRLVNGSNHQEGRLEIKHNGIWGTICDDDFNEDAAKVACRQMGYTGSASVRKDAYFGQGDGPIWLDQVSCFGNESTMEQCQRWNWGEHNCEHSEDVSIICDDPDPVEKHQSVVPTPVVLPGKCGLRNDRLFDQNDEVQARVVRANIAKKGDHPWQAAIRVKGKAAKAAHWCGAVIISSKYVLTAAHCLIGYSKGAYVIIGGDYDVDTDEGTEQETYIEDFYIHPNFREGHKMNNDIALIKLKGKGFVMTGDIQPICLPDVNVKYEADTNCTISGFGSVESGKSAYAHQLHSGIVPIQSNDVCRMPHVYGNALTDGMFCAGYLEGGLDSCDGDSGGPLACLHDGVFTLFGLTSWGHHCGYANKPGVYVKINHYKKWIDDTLKSSSQQ